MLPEVGGTSKVTVCAVGDIALFKRIQNRYQRDKVKPFRYISNILSQSDLLIGNFEFPFSHNGIPYSWESFDEYRVLPEVEDILDGINFDVLSLATNHIMDWGREGLLTTKSILSRRGVRCIGAGLNLSEARQPAIIEKKGLRLGFLAYSKQSTATAAVDRPGSAPIVPEQVCQDIIALRAQVDHVILLLHWGIEFCDYPLPSDVTIGRSFIEAGATVIFGAHAHVIQGIERYKHGLIFYGLGNFIYDPTAERVFVDTRLKERSTCLIARVHLSSNEVLDYEILPCRIDEYGCPRLLASEEAALEMHRIKEISACIGSSNAAFSTAFGNLLAREVRTHLWYLRRDGLRHAWRFIKRMKLRHLKLFLSWLKAKVLRR